MFCCIQKVMLKKPNTYGEHKEIIPYQATWRLDESKPFAWDWKYSDERFERPHLEAYKISLHQSFRENGKVKKRQYSICTMSYYDVVEYSLYDCADGKITSVAEKMNLDAGKIYELIETKLEPLRKTLETEFHQSPEYAARDAHERIRAAYMEAQSKFCARYGVDKDDFTRCYDIFLTLRNKEYLAQIKAESKVRKQAEREAYRSYQQYSRDYGGSSGGYSAAVASNHTEAEKIILRQFYKILAKAYHPDLNPGKNTTEAMALLNRLKENWGL